MTNVCSAVDMFHSSLCGCLFAALLRAHDPVICLRPALRSGSAPAGLHKVHLRPAQKCSSRANLSRSKQTHRGDVAAVLHVAACIGQVHEQGCHSVLGGTWMMFAYGFGGMR